MPQIIYTMKDLRKVTPQGKEILKGIWLSFFPGAKIGVLGHNGAGKTTLLRIMAGRRQGLRRRGLRSPRATRVGFLPQEPKLDAGEDRAASTSRRRWPTRRAVLRALRRELARRTTPTRRADEFAEPAGPDRRRERLGARPPARDRDGRAAPAARRRRRRRRSPAASGAASRSAGCCCSKPDLLLLDEPTNHLDAESVAWLERHLQEYPGTVVAVTHDRYFLDNVAGWILELDRGHGIPCEGNYSSWLEQKQKRLAQEEKEESARQRTLERELEWVRMAPRARQAKSKARLAAYEKLLAEEQAQERAASRSRSTSRPARASATSSSRPKDLSKGYGDKLLIDDLSFTLPRGGIVGVIGPNGAGKTTLFRMIIGQEKPDAGDAARRRDRRARLRRPEPRRARRRASTRLGGDLRRRQRHDRCSASARSTRAPTVAAFNFTRRRPAEEGRRPLGRRAQPRPPGQAAARAAATCCCSTSRPTTSTSTRCARSRRRCSTSPAARWSSATTAGSSTASPPTSWPSRATARCVWFEGNYQDYEADRHAPARRRRRPAAPDQVQEARALGRRPLRLRSGQDHLPRQPASRCLVDASAVCPARPGPGMVLRSVPAGRYSNDPRLDADRLRAIVSCGHRLGAAVGDLGFGSVAFTRVMSARSRISSSGQEVAAEPSSRVRGACGGGATPRATTSAEREGRCSEK